LGGEIERWSAASVCTVRGAVNRCAGAAGATGRRGVAFFLARDDEDVVLFFFFEAVWPSDETAIRDARDTTAMVRSVRYSIVLNGSEIST
jgi:hypothetical protein